MIRGLRQALLMIVAGALTGLVAGAVWAAVGDTGFQRAAGICLMAVAGLLALTGGSVLSRATTTDARAFLGRGPSREDPASGEGLTAAGVFLFVSLPLLVLGLVLLG
ncbi:hypothetical protein SAMN05660662_1494 [Blastococcus aurantiacus]|uniref:Uncharacterized protein n=1 Tax=Blastococcus aurantiacus TaxID=1550231 RepID=A0A1G7JGG1_9ACTN|nr:hypothetical protein [Blastococcus aurantiacus]SDF23935.1 hypothetical protein SAMN05660662_1494 [Blastococcus aurantiacus]